MLLKNWTPQPVTQVWAGSRGEDPVDLGVCKIATLKIDLAAIWRSQGACFCWKKDCFPALKAASFFKVALLTTW